MDILLSIDIIIMKEIQFGKPWCDITVVATRVTKEKQSSHLIPWDNGKLCK